MNSAHEVIHNLWLGDAVSSQSIEFIKSKNINCIFNCTVSSDFLNNSLIIIKKKYRIPVKDNCLPEEINLMYSIFDKTTQLIYKHLQDGDIILVHCHAGRQRSVAVIIAFIMRYSRLTFLKALELLKTKRQVACYPEINFYSALVEYEHYLKTARL